MLGKAELSSSPHLVESTARRYLRTTLETCAALRHRYYGLLLNLGVFALFVLIVGGTLYYCYVTKKQRTKDPHAQLMKDQEYILSKIRFYQEMQQKRKETSASSLADLPFVTPHPEWLAK